MAEPPIWQGDKDQSCADLFASKNETKSNIKNEINETVKKYLPNLVINDISVTTSERNEHVSILRIDYTVTEDTFAETDFILLQI